MKKDDLKLKVAKNRYIRINENGIGVVTTRKGYHVSEEFELPSNLICALIIVLTTISHDFVKANDAEFADQLDANSASLNGLLGPTALADKYGYTTAKLLSIKNDAAYFRYFVTKHGAGPEYAVNWTKKGAEARKGKGTVSSAWPVGADVSTPPTDVAPGIEARFRETAAFAKAQKSIYTEADGVAMHIEVSSSAFVPADGQPDLTVKISEGGHPEIEYIISKYQGANIYKDSGDGKGFVFLHTVNDPKYTDYSTLPLEGKSIVWAYKAVYLYKGKEIGTISKGAPITVTGLVSEV
jgi:hypothetical protein